MWDPTRHTAFERDGHVALAGAFDPAAAARMADAVWSHLERNTDIRRLERSTWPAGPPHVSLKRLKGHAAFRAVVDSPRTRAALDGVFGAGGWEASHGGAQILVTFPDTAPADWRVPSRLWHMDTGFTRRVVPPRAVKLFSVIETLPPRSGATMVLAGTPALQAAYAADAADQHRSGDKTNWHRFLRRRDPWLARFVDADTTVDRSDTLRAPHIVDGQPVELRELAGTAGDVHVCHINLFHSVAPNAGDRPRMMVTHLVRSLDDAREG